MKFESPLKVFGGSEASAFSIVAGFDRSQKSLRLFWEIQGPLEELILPPQVENPEYKEGLWEKTCFEFFCGKAASPHYDEWNFSTSTDWAHFSFESPRQRQVPQRTKRPLTVDFHLESTMLARMSVELEKIDFDVFNLSCVLEHSTRVKTYWALDHRRSQPDFHDRISWSPINL